MKKRNIQNTDPEDLDILIPDETFWDKDCRYYFAGAAIYKCQKDRPIDPAIKYYDMKEAREKHEGPRKQ